MFSCSSAMRKLEAISFEVVHEEKSEKRINPKRSKKPLRTACVKCFSSIPFQSQKVFLFLRFSVETDVLLADDRTNHDEIMRSDINHHWSGSRMPCTS